jgi:triphosphatase
MWDGDRLIAQRALARGVSISPALQIAGGHALRRAEPVRADTIALAANASADQAFEIVLTHYAAVIAENLRCVLTESDPEGAHQMRVTLRRLRTALRVFKPAIRGTSAKRVAWVARYLGAIVGELRDVDVIIDEMLRPAFERDAMALRAAHTWREHVRTKVRASLNAARATAFANDLLSQSTSGEWRVKGKRMRRTGSAGALIKATLRDLKERVTPRGEKLRALPDAERHSLRKQLKTLRYTAELSVAYDANAVAMVGQLKRLQGDLGKLNDMHMLTSVELEHLGLALVRRQLIEEHQELIPALIESAAARWSQLATTAGFAKLR